MAALGYSKVTEIPLELAFVRNHYVGRSFINPNHAERDDIVRMKLTLIDELVRDKRVIIIDDSIVRGTTSKARCRKVREAGAREVHMLVSCPPHMWPCIYGIDFPNRDKLIATQNNPEGIAKHLGLDSLGYLSEAGMVRAIGSPDLCLACFNGNYPTVIRGDI